MRAHPSISKDRSGFYLTATIVMIAALALMLCGCANPRAPRDSIPATVIRATLNGKPAEAVLPKDVAFDYLKFSVETNGAVSLVISNLAARTNPDVIQMSGESYSRAIEAQGKANAASFEAGAKLVGAIPVP
jgi:hypothetical protein